MARGSPWTVTVAQRPLLAFFALKRQKWVKKTKMGVKLASTWFVSIRGRSTGASLSHTSLAQFVLHAALFILYIIFLY